MRRTSPSTPGHVGVYGGRRIALLTQHGKERVIVPVLEPALGCRVERVAGYDTDLLGTFTRDIPRAGTQLEAARKKAHLSMELAGLPLGLASEGSFGPDPFTGILPWNIEMLIWIDNERELEVVGVAQGAAVFSHLVTSDWATAKSFAGRLGFPEHYLVVRPESEGHPHIRKGIASWAELEAEFDGALEQSASGQVFLETDVRAHANPTRMETIRLAAEDLAKKLCSLCPACGTPGFSIMRRVAGLPCRECGEPTRETCAEDYGCLKCEHRLMRVRPDRQYAEPVRCDYCNP